MKQFLIILLVLMAVIPDAQSQLSYPYDSIPSFLRVGAKAVLRSGQRIITLVDEKQSRLETKIALTLLNDKAKDMLMVGISYDRFRHISSIRAKAYNKSGKLIWILRNYEISDVRDFGGPEKLSDARKKVFEIPSFNYPFTIEYSYTMTMEDLFLSPAVYLQQDPGISVEESGLQYIIPKGSGFSYKTLNLKFPADSVQRKNKLYLSWNEENIPAGRQRKYATSLVKKLPVVYATPIDFSLSGYKGSFKTWREYGSWMGQLIAGRDILDQAYAEKAEALIKDIPEQREKIKVLYEYMQKTTHYFFIGFGVGGNQPIPANEVAMNGYGDCKALCNYMKALLKSVGIESYYTLVRSGEGKSMQADFPCNQFDHVILCVPDHQDTIWLECTDPNSPFNYLGSFTCDRYALAITPEGGRLLRTPSYDSSVNMAQTYSEILLQPSGDADIKLEMRKHGLLCDEIMKISESKSSDRKSWLADKIGLSGFELKKEEYEFNRQAEIPAALASFELHIRDLAAKSSQLLFITPSFVSDLFYIYDDPDEVELPTAYQQDDSVRIEIPSGLSIEHLPEGKQIRTRFGSFGSEISTDGKFIYFRRKLSFNKGNYPRESYPEFYQFITDITTADKEMVVLKHTN